MQPYKSGNDDDSRFYRKVGMLVGSMALASAAWLGWKELSLQSALFDSRAAIAQGQAESALNRLKPYFSPTLSPWHEVRRAYTAAWEKRAEEFARLKQFSAAKAALQSAADCATAPLDKEAVASHRQRLLREEADELVVRGEPGKAAGIFLEMGDIRRAAQLLATAHRFTDAAKLAGEKLADAKWAQELWTSAAEAAAQASDWPGAGGNYEKAERWSEAVEAYLQAGSAKKAAQIALLRTVPPRVKAKAFQAAGDWRGAADIYLQQGMLDEAADVYVAENEWEAAANLFHKQTQFAKAAEIFQRGKLWERAGAEWLAAGEAEQARAAFDRGIRRHMEQQHTGDAVALLEGVPNAKMRAGLVQAHRDSFNPSTQAPELAAFLVLGGDWAGAGQIYERLGALRAAADAWHNNNDTKAEADALRRAAAAEADSALALRAAAVFRSRNELAAEEEMLDLAFNQALARKQAQPIAEIFTRRGHKLEGADRLLALGELWVQTRENDAAAALAAAVSLLPSSTFNTAIKALYARSEALQAKIAEAVRRRPTALPSGTNYYGANGRFVQTIARIEVTNPSVTLKNAVLVIELLEKAPELYREAASSQFADSAGQRAWLWSNRDALNNFSRSQNSHVERNPLEDVAANAVQTVEFKLINHVPYRFIRVWIEEKETDAVPSPPDKNKSEKEGSPALP